MRSVLFDIPVFSYTVQNWKSKKTQITEWLDKTTLSRPQRGHFYSDREFSRYNKFYAKGFADLLHFELKSFKDEVELPSLSMVDVWFVEYEKGDFHVPHTHRSVGFSGILYVNFNKEEHPSTTFIQPWPGIFEDETIMKNVEAQEGTVLIVPSNLLHFTEPSKSDQKRTIMGFDLLPYAS